MNQPAPERSPDSLRWLSNDYAVLRRKARKTVYDVVVVGSGYGGAMAAAEFAGLRKPDGSAVSVCVLERGKEYAPGMFPSSLQELPPHVRIHQDGKHKTTGRLDALLDVRVGRDVCAVVGNGLGGTSLINAGVMVAPQLRPGQFPQALMAALTPAYFAEVKQMLGATDALPKVHPDLQGRPLRKTEELRRVGRRNGVPYEDAAITVQAEPGDPYVAQCTLCGDCMTGCNVGAKKSVDTTLLARAWGKGAEIYTGASVMRVRRARNGTWLVQANFTDESMRRRHRARAIRARKVVLAAGTLGSTEILFRSRSRDLRLSRLLGKQFSCNGDNLLAVHDGPYDVHSTAKEWEGLRTRHVGPTITGILRGQGFLLQEFAIPAALRRLFEESVTTTRLLHGLSEFPWATASQKQQGLDTAAVDPRAMDKTLVVGLIGHDDARWKLLRQRRPRWQKSRSMLEGQLRIARNDPQRRGNKRDPNAPQVPRMQQDYEEARKLLQQASPQAGVVPNPLWKPLPDSLMNLMPGARGPVLTVHPLGGCPMGGSPADGVVDHLGRVFRAAPAGAAPAFHDGLMVLDGAIVPGSLAANPALTIAAIARHAAHTLAADWGWRAGSVPVRVPLARPIFRPVEACTPPQAPVPTLVELMERLAGPVGPYWVELTIAFAPTSVTALANDRTRPLVVNPEESLIRVYPGGPSARTDYLLLKEDERDDAALFKAKLEGQLTIVEPELGLSSALAAFGAWWRNRGLREIADQVMYRVRKFLGEPVDEVPASVDWTRFPESAARAGQQRCFDYDLQIRDVALDIGQPDDEAFATLATAHLKGTKKVTYSVKCNPWRQLMELALTGFPGVAEPSVLKLDGRFLAGKGVPLLAIRQQQNQMVALADFASLGMAWARMLLSVHLWSFRSPDKLPPRSTKIEPGHRRKTSVLLPGPIDGLPAPRQHWLPLQPYQRVDALLTQYEHPGAKKPPIVLVHGYSASGNTYTHRAIPVPLARYLWEDGREVWVLDLRTSCGLVTAKEPWAFEDVAFADLPVAIDFVARHTGQKVDVFAHCIGAVMLGMALLTDAKALQAFRHVDVKARRHRPKRWEAELQRLPQHVRRIVLSQKGPLLVYSDANVLRAYFMRLLRKFLLPENYQFHAARTDGARHNLMDRLLSTMVYPDDEYERENPFSWGKRARWAGFRHRMDALYARDFTLGNISDRTLDAIDELFGPLNIDTVAQAIHFARKNVITDANGLPFDATRPALAARWPKGGTLSIHGADNGLADVKSLEVLQSAMQFANVPFEALPICFHGHQDCLIGETAATSVFPHVTRFLNQPEPPQAVPVQLDCDAMAAAGAAASIASAVAAAGSGAAETVQTDRSAS